MTDDIVPALTPEQWEYEHRPLTTTPGGCSNAEFMLSEVCEEWQSPRRPVTRHSLAAIALHGQPFGFTWDDIYTLDRYLGAYGNRLDVTAVLNKIAALLPPPTASRVRNQVGWTRDWTGTG